MLTKITIRNFKQFQAVELELGNPVVFIGPNNSGKTTALQAIALWDIGLRRWREKRRPEGRGAQPPKQRPGVTISRNDLISTPVSDVNLLWRDLHVRDVQRTNGKQSTSNVRIDIIVEGVNDNNFWKCGLEFDYANAESLYCRPLRLEDADPGERMEVPEDIMPKVAYLPPMSGLGDREFVKQPGELNFLIGQGRTAEVLRNLCMSLVLKEDGRWDRIVRQIQSLFGVTLDEPIYVAERAEIVMTYRTRSGIRLDLSSSGRGLQQTLLLLAYLGLNPDAALLLDEPDAHLEILRQRQIYQILADTAREQGSQIIIASHSEVILNEAASRDIVIAFVGQPHRIDDRGSHLQKALREIGFDQYYLAEERGWVLYLEGSTDLAILQQLAAKLGHKAQSVLERPFVYYVENQPNKARHHFYGLKEACPNLYGYLLTDRLSGEKLQSNEQMKERMWKRREIENYLCSKDILLAWATDNDAMKSDSENGSLFEGEWEKTMRVEIDKLEMALQITNQGSPWSPDFKVSDLFLTPLFVNFYKALGLPNLMNKTNFHQLAHYLPADKIDLEIVEVLDEIVALEEKARQYAQLTC